MSDEDIKKAVIRSHNEYMSHVQDKYEEMVWELSMQFGVEEDKIKQMWEEL